VLQRNNLPSNDPQVVAASECDAKSPAKSWRDVGKIHPAAKMFPQLVDGELRELAEDIKKNRQRVPIGIFPADLESEAPLDGRSRLDEMELAGISIIKILVEDIQTNVDPVDHAILLNAHRRHVSSEKKRELIAKVLKATPGRSNPAIGKRAAAERILVAFFTSHRIYITDVAGMPIVEVIRYREASEIDEADEIATASLSLEHLAKNLEEHLGIPS
jgi:hypothetical protein